MYIINGTVLISVRSIEASDTRPCRQTENRQMSQIVSKQTERKRRKRTSKMSERKRVSFLSFLFILLRDFKICYIVTYSMYIL